MNVSDLLLGLAIGDAYGAGVEFQDRRWIEKNVDFKTFVNARHLIKCRPDQSQMFIENYIPWNYTDDTEMTIGIIKALVSSDTFTEKNLIKEFLKEYRLGEKLNGYGRNGHGSMSWFYSGSKTIDEIRDFQRDRPNPGNAPAMRSVPLGLISENLINRYCTINATATHPNSVAIASSQVIAWASRYILFEVGDKHTIIEYVLEKMIVNSEFRMYLSEVDNLSFEENLSLDKLKVLCGSQPIQAPYFMPGIEGLPSDSKYTVGVVLYILKNISKPFEGLKYAIKIGGDVDSSASIVTAILSGRYGVDSLPEFMINNVEGKAYLKMLATEFEAFAKA